MFTPELQEAKMAELPSVNLTEIEKMKVITRGHHSLHRLFIRQRIKAIIVGIGIPWHRISVCENK